MEWDKWIFEMKNCELLPKIRDESVSWKVNLGHCQCFRTWISTYPRLISRLHREDNGPSPFSLRPDTLRCKVLPPLLLRIPFLASAMAATAAAATAAVLRLGFGTPGRVFRLPLRPATTYRSRFFQGAAARPRREDPAAAAPTAVDSSRGESRESSEKLASLWGDILENKRYRDKEAAILKDIEPIRMLTKKILHSER